VESGGTHQDADFRRAGAPAPALTIWCAPEPKPNPKGEVKPWRAQESRELRTSAFSPAIHALLSEGRPGTATIEGRPVQPGDIAALVRTHNEATRIQQALANVGIPAVAAGKQSLYATLEARELHALLLALLQSGDDGRLRAALSTVLIGVDATAIAALDDNVHDWQHQALAWRERLLRGGPLALIGDLCAQHAPRLLGLTDGERRVGNYLQLAEALQEAQAETLGLHGLVDWLGARIANADPDDEAQLLRLESDARRVQIVTLHKSKGLEYPLVFLPFAGIGRPEPSPGRGCVAQGGEDNARRLHWKFDVPEAEWEDARERWGIEQHAEQARLLYVGLTRARHALWRASGRFLNADRTAPAPMLANLAALQAEPCIRVDTVSPPAVLPRLPPETDAEVPPAAVATRALSTDWWVHSFSSLTRKGGLGEDASTSATLPAPGGRDEGAVADDEAGPVHDPRFAGPQFGVAMHTALGRTDFAAWREWLPGAPAPGDEAETIAK